MPKKKGKCKQTKPKRDPQSCAQRSAKRRALEKEDLAQKTALIERLTFAWFQSLVNRVNQPYAEVLAMKGYVMGKIQIDPEELMKEVDSIHRCIDVSKWQQLAQGQGLKNARVLKNVYSQCKPIKKIQKIIHKQIFRKMPITEKMRAVATLSTTAIGSLPHQVTTPQEAHCDFPKFEGLGSLIFAVDNGVLWTDGNGVVHPIKVGEFVFFTANTLHAGSAYETNDEENHRVRIFSYIGFDGDSAPKSLHHPDDPNHVFSIGSK